MSLAVRLCGCFEKRCLEEEMKRPPEFFECSDVWGEVVQFLPVEDTNRIAQTCHMLRERIFDVKSGILREYVSRHAFGAYKWEHYFGRVKRIPLPLKLFDILEEPCHFFEGKKVKDTHILFYLPKTVDGKALTLNRLGELVGNPNQGSPTRYDCFGVDVKEMYGYEPTGAPHWVLMTRNVIPGSRGKSFGQQCMLIPLTGGYDIPKVLEATVGVFLHFIETGEKLFSGVPWTYTRCEEQTDWRYRIIVGGFDSFGLDVDDRSHEDLFDSRQCGLAVLRKFSDPDKQVKEQASGCCSLQ